MEITPIAEYNGNLPEKFGVPRQSGLAHTIGKITFKKEFSDENAIRGLNEYSHIWLIWEFSQNEQTAFSPTVRPPKLGGNTRVGVFATRSPNRPNRIGLSSVRLIEIIKDKGVISLLVEGADLANNTPIYDIKPYIPYSDVHNDANGSFSDELSTQKLSVKIPDEYRSKLTINQINELIEILALDPRPGYSEDGEEIYKMSFSNFTVSFKVLENYVYVVEII